MVDLAGMALVVSAIATPLTVLLTWWETHRAADRKEKQAILERREARRTQMTALATLSDKQDQVHTLVNNRSSQQDAKIEALSTALSKGGIVPEMAADDAAPGQVTRDGGVISVGKGPKEG